MAAPSFQDLCDAGKAEALLRRPELALNPTDVSGMYMAAAAAMGDRILGWAADRVRATYLDGASGDDLTTWVDDRYGIQRTAAVEAGCTVTFHRATHTAGAGTIPAGTRIATAADSAGLVVEFVTDDALPFGATDEELSVHATASVAGLAGNVTAAAIARILDTLWDTSLTVTNAAAVGGAEEEGDAALRDRARAYPLTMRRATLAALEYGAKQVTTVKWAHAVADETGFVYVYVADDEGNSDATMTDAVTAELVNWLAAECACYVVGGTQVVQPVTIEVTLADGVTLTEVTALIQAAVAARINKGTVGQTLYVSQLVAAAVDADPARILNATISVPSGDVVPGGADTLRAGTVTVTEP